MTFDIGNIMEPAILRDIQDAGFQVIEQQRSFSWPEYQITGHLDAKVIINGEAIPLEIKTSSPYVFKSINSIHDLTNGKYGYLRKYPAQLTLYCLMGNHDRGIFIFKDKSSGAMKEIEMPLDYELGESLLKRAEAINAHVVAGTMPEPISEEMWCEGCPFAHICLPEQIGKEVEIDTGELATILDRMEEIKPLAKEYDKLDNQVKETVEGREKILAGNYFITGKWIEKKAAQIAASTYWKKTIKRISA
jgi:CRISPR/Cas system-associated exonuclease Cas4 (RecB family)